MIAKIPKLFLILLLSLAFVGHFPLLANAEQGSVLTPSEARERHAEAIAIGLRDLEIHLQQDPELSGMSEQDYKDYAIELMDTFLAGQEAWVIADLVKYAPAFSSYVIVFPEDFIMSEGVRASVNIEEQNRLQVESQERTAEAQERTAEAERNIFLLQEIQKELDLLSETLRANSQ